MATVLTLGRTPSRAESCSFSESTGPWEVPADEGDTAGRNGPAGGGVKGYFGLWGGGGENALLPPARLLPPPQPRSPHPPPPPQSERDPAGSCRDQAPH